ncbi:MAG: structural protein P5 [Gammaproteobacteria bacterium]
MTSMQTRGIRNNNPGNLRINPANKWQGRVPENQRTDNEFEQFVSPVMGIRAMAVLLINYQDFHNLSTISDIIRRWAPPEDNNNTDAYVFSVARRTKIPPDMPLDLHRYEDLRPLLEAMIYHENGVQPYDDATIDAGLARAGVAQVRRNLAESRTIKGGGIAAAATGAGLAVDLVQDESAQVSGILETVATYAPQLQTLIAVIALIAIGLIIRARWDDWKKGLR